MTNMDIIGFVGVTVLLIAHFLNLTNKIEKDSLIYLQMNFLSWISLFSLGFNEVFALYNLGRMLDYS